jgi:membrane protein DedA with SNARE-associated domain
VTSRDAPRFTTIVFLIWGGLLTWAGYFLFVYVFAALACARQFHHLTVAGIDVVTFATLLPCRSHSRPRYGLSSMPDVAFARMSHL